VPRPASFENILLFTPVVNTNIREEIEYVLMFKAELIIVLIVIGRKFIFKIIIIILNTKYSIDMIGTILFVIFMILLVPL
jgi:hypothetical protein